MTNDSTEPTTAHEYRIDDGWIVAPTGKQIARVDAALTALAVLGGATVSTMWVAEYPNPDAPIGTIVVGSNTSAEEALACARQQPGVTAHTVIRVTERVTRTITTTSEVQP